eukprot:TRINITY_DN6995_c0_g1_i3.p1 TRINITY_DN6995_c0_g1~~TRINITY_DN6995_c0_g1_i3.p1  ORF type:complete len:509 (+),score=99.91 TRINITY_DN6995_c0_g1_i3:53-1579(+)
MEKTPLLESDSGKSLPSKVADEPGSPRPYLKERELSWTVKLAYATGGFSIFLYATVKGFYFVVFLADVAEMNPIASGTILLVGKFFDAITDPIVGQLSDCTKSSWGRRKPWMFWGAIPFAVFYFLLWQAPEFLQDNEALKVAYYFIISVLLDAAATVVYVPYSALLTDLADSYHMRTVLTTQRQILGLLGTVVGAVGHGLTLAAFEDEDDPIQGEKDGYFYSAIWIGMLIALPWFIVSLMVPERPVAPDQIESHESLSHFVKRFVQEVKSLMDNRTYVIIVFVYGLAVLLLSLFQSSFVFWIENVLEEEDAATYLLLLVTLGVAFILVLATKVSQKYGKKTAYFFFAAVGLPSQAALFFVGSGDLTTVLILLPLQTFAGAISLMLPLAMLPDVIDKDELDTGKRREGSYFSFFLMAQKVGQAVALSVVNYALAGAGYKEPTEDDDDDPEQPDSVLLMLRVLIGPASALCGVASVVLLYYYPLTKDAAEEIRGKLHERRTMSMSTQSVI